MRYFCMRWGAWMVKNWHLYHEELTRFGPGNRYKRMDWRKVI